MGSNSSFFHGAGNPSNPTYVIGNNIVAFPPQPHYFLTGLSSAGVFSAAQPSFADISGKIDPSQIPPAALLSLGGVDAITPVAHEWVAYIDTSGVQHLSQPSYTDLSGTYSSSAHQWITGFSGGNFVSAQPAFTDISGVATAAQIPSVLNQTAVQAAGPTLQALNTDAESTSGQEALLIKGTITGSVNGGGPYIQFSNGSNVGSIGLRYDTVHTLFYMPFYVWNGSAQAEYMRIAQGGNVGIGQTNPQYKLDVNGEVNAVSGYRYNGAATTGHVLRGNGTDFVDAQLGFSDLSGSVAAAQLPNPSATTLGGIESLAAVSHKWINTISTSGVPSATQPAFTDISGSVAASQLPNPSASTLGGIESYAAVTHQWINAISTSGVPSSTQPAFSDLSGSATTGQLPANQTIASIQFVIDGAGTTLTTGMHGYLEVPFGCTINQVTLLADQSGSVVVNVWKTTYANFDAGTTHPVAADKITASAPPTISSAKKAQDSTLTGWTTSISAGDILAFNIDSVTTITRVTIDLKVTKT